MKLLLSLALLALPSCVVTDTARDSWEHVRTHTGVGLGVVADGRQIAFPLILSWTKDPEPEPELVEADPPFSPLSRSSK